MRCLWSEVVPGVMRGGAMEKNVKFCTKCGEKQEIGAKFCTSCGHAFRMGEMKAVQKIPASAGVSGGVPDYGVVIKSNLNYYQGQFKQLEETGKSRINWASFFLGVIHAGYRNMTREWLLALKVPLIMVGASLLLVLLALIGIPALSIAAIMLFGLGEVILAIKQIIFALSFNKLYKVHVETKLQKGDSSPDPSVGRGAAVSLIYGMAIGVVIAAIVAGFFASLMSEVTDYDRDLSGEYGNWIFDEELAEPAYDAAPVQVPEASLAIPTEEYSENDTVFQRIITYIDADEIFESDDSKYVSWGPNDSGYYLVPYQDETGYSILFTVENSTANAYQAYYMNVDTITYTENGGISVLGDVMTASGLSPEQNGYFEVLWDSPEEIDFPVVTIKDGSNTADLGLEGIYAYFGYVDHQIFEMEGDTGYTEEDYSAQYGVKADSYYVEEQIRSALTDPDGYLIPEVDQAYIYAEDYDWLDRETLRLAINEVYARHGRSFQAEELKNYFSSKNWYMPLYSADEFDESVLNVYEKENIKVLAEIRDNLN